MSDDERIKIRRILEAHPEATKHTVPDSQRHQPVDSPLIRTEITKHFAKWIDSRRNHEFPVDAYRSSDKSLTLFSSSMTTAIDCNSASYREMAAVLKENGSILPIHLLPHNDEKRHFEKLEQERISTKIRYKISDNEE